MKLLRYTQALKVYPGLNEISREPDYSPVGDSTRLLRIIPNDFPPVKEHRYPCAKCGKEFYTQTSEIEHCASCILKTPEASEIKGKDFHRLSERWNYILNPATHQACRDCGIKLPIYYLCSACYHCIDCCRCNVLRTAMRKFTWAEQGRMELAASVLSARSNKSARLTSSITVLGEGKFDLASAITDYYVCDEILAKDTLSYGTQRAIREHQTMIGNQIELALFDYSAAACYGEARYWTSGWFTFFLDKNKDFFVQFSASDYAKLFGFTTPKQQTRSWLYKNVYEYDPVELCKIIYRVFSNIVFHPKCGGHLWAQIAKAVVDRGSYRVQREYIDRLITLAHNGGAFLTKHGCMRFTHDSDRFAHIVTLSGLYPTLIDDPWVRDALHITDWLRSLFERCDELHKYRGKFKVCTSNVYVPVTWGKGLPLPYKKLKEFWDCVDTMWPSHGAADIGVYEGFEEKPFVYSRTNVTNGNHNSWVGVINSTSILQQDTQKVQLPSINYKVMATRMGPDFLGGRIRRSDGTLEVIEPKIARSNYAVTQIAMDYAAKFINTIGHLAVMYSGKIKSRKFDAEAYKKYTAYINTMFGYPRIDGNIEDTLGGAKIVHYSLAKQRPLMGMSEATVRWLQKRNPGYFEEVNND